MDASLLKELLELDSETGFLYWKISPSNNVRLGSRAGTLHKATGYRAVKIAGKAYKEHRVIWALQTGHWPEDEIDHINGTRDDNRPLNLREATRAQNTCNCADYKTNKSGHRGVHWDSNAGKWKAQITVLGKRRHLGLFSDIKQAAHAYKIEAQKHNYTFRRTG